MSWQGKHYSSQNLWVKLPVKNGSENAEDALVFHIKILTLWFSQCWRLHQWRLFYTVFINLPYVEEGKGGGGGGVQGAAFQLGHFNYTRVPPLHISPSHPLPSPVLSSRLCSTMAGAFCLPPLVSPLISPSPTRLCAFQSPPLSSPPCILLYSALVGNLLT